MIHIHIHPRQCSLIIVMGNTNYPSQNGAWYPEPPSLRSARPDSDDLSQRGSNYLNLKL